MNKFISAIVSAITGNHSVDSVVSSIERTVKKLYDIADRARADADTHAMNADVLLVRSEELHIEADRAERVALNLTNLTR